MLCSTRWAVLERHSLLLLCVLALSCWRASVAGQQVTEGEFREVAGLLPEPGILTAQWCEDGSLWPARRRYDEAVASLLRRPGCAELAAHLLHDPDRKVRHTCISVIASLTPRGLEEQIFRRLKDGQETWRPLVNAGLSAIARYRTRRAGELLLECLDMPPNPDWQTGDGFRDWKADERWKETVMHALGQVRQPQVAPRIIEYLDKPLLREFVLAACAKARNPIVVPRIRSLLASAAADLEKFPESHRGSQTQFVGRAALALWFLHQDSESFKLLVAVDRKCAWLDRAKRDHSYLSIHSDFRPDVIPTHILTACTSGERTARKLADWYLAHASGDQTPLFLSPEEWQERIKRVGNRVVALLADRLSDPCPGSALAHLAGRLDTATTAERAAVALALKKLVLSDRNSRPWRCFEELPRCLYACRGPGTRDLLERLTLDPQGQIATRAASYLCRIDGEAGVQRLRHLARSGCPDTARSAAGALLRFGDAAGVPVLLKAAREAEMDSAVIFARQLCSFLCTEFRGKEFRIDRAKELLRLQAIWQASNRARGEDGEKQ